MVPKDACNACSRLGPDRLFELGDFRIFGRDEKSRYAGVDAPRVFKHGGFGDVSH